MGLSEDIGSLLTAANVCSTSAGSTGWLLCYREYQPVPPMPTRQICVVQTGGFQTEFRSPISRPTFQIRIRGSSGEGVAFDTKVQAVIDAVNFQSGILGPNNWTYVDIQMQGDRLYLGRDERQRPAESVNFLATRSRTS